MSNLALATNNSARLSTSGLKDLAPEFMSLQKMYYLCTAMEDAGVSTGGYVSFPRELGCLPSLQGIDGNLIYLYKLIEGMDNALDYERLLKQYSTLTFSHIAGVMSFLRKVAQVNLRSVDIDALEEEFELDEVRQAFEQIGDVADVFLDAE